MTQRPPAVPAATWPIATSLADRASTSWAVVQLGGSSAQHENFWELFVRPASAESWKEVTPPGVASNGGLIVAGGGASLFAGFRPSQLLTFSPLAATTDQGASWTQGDLVSPGLASVPDALAAGPGGQLLALTDNGTARLGARDGASWRCAGEPGLAGPRPAGRACGLISLSAVAFERYGHTSARW